MASTKIKLNQLTAAETLKGGCMLVNIGGKDYQYPADGFAMQQDLNTLYDKGGISVDVSDQITTTPSLVIKYNNQNVTDAGWYAGFLNLKRGDVLTLTSALGSFVVDEDMAYIIRVDDNNKVLSPLAWYHSEGTVDANQSVSGTVDADGRIYVRLRTDQDFKLTLTRGFLNKGAIIDDNGDSLIEQIELLSQNKAFIQVPDADTEVTKGLVYYVDGTTVNDPSWNAVFVKVQKGDQVRYHGHMGSNTYLENMGYIIQMDADKNFVAPIGIFISQGQSDYLGTVTATATQDGYVYFRVRLDGSTPIISKVGELFASQADLVNFITLDYLAGYTKKDALDDFMLSAAWLPPAQSFIATKMTQYQVPNTVMYSDGSVVDLGSGSQWTMYYIPVIAGDTVKATFIAGSGVANEVAGYLMQCDKSKRYVADLYTHTNGSSGGIQTVTESVTATQDGYIAVRYRSGSNDIQVTKANALMTKSRLADALTAAGLTTSLITTDYTNQTNFYVNNQVMYNDGTINNLAAGSGWRMYYIPVNKFDIITANLILGSTKVGEQIGYILQLDSNKNYVNDLFTYLSDGTIGSSTQACIGIATQDGYVGVRFRSGSGTVVLGRADLVAHKADLADFPTKEELAEELAKAGVTTTPTTVDVVDNTDYYVPDEVMYSGGSVVELGSGSSWRMYYLPVFKGDSVKATMTLGSNTLNEVIAYIMQCGWDKAWVGDLYTYTVTKAGSYTTATVQGTATQDGYIAVRVRNGSGNSVIITNQNGFVDQNSLVKFADAREKALSSKLGSATGVAKVFNAEYHRDISNLPEVNPNFNTFDSPLNYTFRKQWGRRDFYNAADSYMLSFMDLDNNPWHAKSNIYDIQANAVHTASWTNGVATLGAASAVGRTAIFADKYLPFATSELAISAQSGTSSLGLFFGTATLSDGLSVRYDGSKIIIEVYVAGAIAKTTTFTSGDLTGKVLQVQNTGLSLLIKAIDGAGNWTWIGRVGYKDAIDARQVTFLDTWKTYILAQTDDTSNAGSVSFTGFSNRLASGANSVSIRFLTYEDGTFIQRGAWMYYLVEGTGTSISDLYTQIVRINFNSGEVQMIGGIFQVRTDGTDENILLGDDSIKVVYDRNSKTWKGISCGMEYNDYTTGNLRPKLYFETKQDIIQGGIIIVKNSVQLKMSDGTMFGTGSGYVEDIDFFYDTANKQWVLTGNSVSSGCKTFRSPTLYDQITTEFTTDTVPTGVRDTGNQFVNFNGTMYLTSGGTANKLHLRKYESGLTYLGELVQDAYLSPSTNGPWCTLVPFTNGDEVDLFLLSFDRSDLYGGLPNGGQSYDHGGLYCWKATK